MWTTQSKRPVTLDLDCPVMTKKKGLEIMLTSPDLDKLKWTSPELEKFIIAFNGSTTKSAHSTWNGTKASADNLSTLCAPSSSAFSMMEATNPTSFLSLARPPSVVSNSYNNSQPYFPFPASNTSTNMEKLQTLATVSSSISPLLLPINLEHQKDMKLERKRLMNRIAASKCRRRKLERIAKLEEEMNEQENEKAELSTLVSTLRKQMCDLQQEMNKQEIDKAELGALVCKFRKQLREQENEKAELGALVCKLRKQLNEQESEKAELGALVSELRKQTQSKK